MFLKATYTLKCSMAGVVNATELYRRVVKPLPLYWPFVM